MNRLTTVRHRSYRVVSVLLVLFVFGLFAQTAFAAGSLNLSPTTGVYTKGKTFTIRVNANTGGEPINAAEGTLSFNNKELQVTNISQSGSIFNLWTVQPEFSNGNGTITFGGGTPSGYSGSNGKIITITFKSLKAATSRVNFTAGAMLAADGRGTNILQDMNGGTYTIQAGATTPPPEYVSPPNTPDTPIVTSSTHPDGTRWYNLDDVSFAWNVPSDITNVRLTADASPYTTPAVFYETPITGKQLEDFEEGAWYLHVQFRNGNGWGRVAHFPFNIDITKPESFTITKVDEIDLTDPRIAFRFTAEDKVSGVVDYEIRIDSDEPILWRDDGTGIYKVDGLTPGDHTMVVKALDRAGNYLTESITFSVEALTPPRITDYPDVLNSGGILVVRGETLPQATVTMYVAEKGEDPQTFVVASNDDGAFTFVMDEKPGDGIYKLWADATDLRGAKSDPTEKLTFVVRPAGIFKVGTLVISYLSIIIPLLALLVLAILLTLYSWGRIAAFRRRLKKEVTEAEAALVEAMDEIEAEIKTHLKNIENAKTKRALTQEEERMTIALQKKLADAEKNVGKEIRDIRLLQQERKR